MKRMFEFFPEGEEFRKMAINGGSRIPPENILKRELDLLEELGDLEIAKMAILTMQRAEIRWSLIEDLLLAEYEFNDEEQRILSRLPNERIKQIEICPRHLRNSGHVNSLEETRIIVDVLRKVASNMEYDELYPLLDYFESKQKALVNWTMHFLGRDIGLRNN